MQHTLFLLLLLLRSLSSSATSGSTAGSSSNGSAARRDRGELGGALGNQLQKKNKCKQSPSVRILELTS